MAAGDAQDEISGGGGWLRHLVEPALIAAVMVSGLTALLYYLGYVRAQVICNYFGIEVGLLGYAVPDFVLRASRVVFDPLPMIGLAVLAGLGAHLVLAWWLRRQSPRSRRYRAVVPVLTGVTLVLFAAALDGFGQLPAGPGKVSPQYAAITLGLGAILAEYTFRLAEFQRLRRWRQLRRSRRQL